MFLLKNNNKKANLSRPLKAVRGRISNFKFFARGGFLRQMANTRQAGITLLLAILILSSVLAISFSLATVMFVEIRSSGDLLKTEPALYAATGVGEEAFFNIERHLCTSNPSYCTYPTSFTNNVVLNGNPTILATSSPIIIDKVKAGSTFNNTLNNYDFCTAASGTSGCGYGSVTVSYLPTNGSAPLNAYLCQFDATGNTLYSTQPCTATGTVQSYWLMSSNGPAINTDGSATLYPSQAVTWQFPISTLQQKLILTNPGSANDIYVKISTFVDTGGVSGKGLPYVGKTAVEIDTENASVGRKIQVVVPNSSSGYVP